jgi:hypothetical protein
MQKIKVKVPLINPKAQRGGRCIAVLFLDLGARRGGWSASRPGRFTLGGFELLLWLGKQLCEKE